MSIISVRSLLSEKKQFSLVSFTATITTKIMDNGCAFGIALMWVWILIEGYFRFVDIRNLYKITFEDVIKFGEVVQLFSIPRDEKLRKSFPACVDQMSDKQLEMLIGSNKLKHFNSYVKHFLNKRSNLESFEYGVPLIRGMPYEKILQMKKLKHLYIWIHSSLKEEFLDALHKKPGEMIKSFSIKGAQLTTAQIQSICDTLKLSLENFCVWCKEVPIEHLLKLQKLKSLHIQMPSITNAQVMELIKGLPRLKTLNMRKCQLLTVEFVTEARDWLANINQQEKLTIYVQGSTINFEELTGNGPLLEVIEKQQKEMVCMSGELSTEDN